MSRRQMIFFEVKRMAIRQTTIRFEESLIKEIKMICLQKDTTLNDVAKSLFIKWVEENKEQEKE